MRVISYLLLLVSVFISIPYTLYGQDATSTPSPAPTSSESSNSSSKSDLENRKKELEEKLQQASKQKDTLSSQIEYMDTQVYLTEVKVEQTESQIEDKTKEIDSLTTRIDGLDKSLDNLSETLIDRVVDGYKQRRVSMFEYFLDSENANEFLGRVKYQKTAQENNQRLLFQVQQTKSKFKDMKDLKEKKKEELANQKEELSGLRQELLAQQESKEQLLAVTKNDETAYRRQIDEINRQISQFKSFVATTGVGTIGANSLGTGDGGWYMSQRDSRWAGQRMGDSGESVLDVGCFITSIAMVMKFYGQDYTPATIASQAKYFYGGSSSACFPTSNPTAYACHPSGFNGSWGGKSYKNISYDQIPSYLSRNVPVISGVRGGSHYIVLKKMDGSEYIMNDPIYGPDLKVSQYYSLSGPYGVFE